MSDALSVLDVKIQGVAGAFQLDMAFFSKRLVTAVFGRSGAGKTTLIHMLAGLLCPLAGKIQIGQEVVFDSDKKINVPVEERRVGLVFQDSRLFPHLNVMRNLTYSQWAGRRHSALKLEEVVELLALGPLLKRRPDLLSGGEKQRVAIGRALLSNPRILLLDEPLASLDRAHKQEILPFLEKVAKTSQIPLCYVSHSLEEIRRIAQNIVLLSEGRVLAFGPVSEILPQMVGAKA